MKQQPTKRAIEGSTYIEIIIAILIITLTSVTFVSALGFALGTLRGSQQRYETVQKAEETMEMAVCEITLLGREQMTDAFLEALGEKYSSDNLKTTICSREEPEGLYIVRIVMLIGGSGYESSQEGSPDDRWDVLQTQVYLR